MPDPRRIAMSTIITTVLLSLGLQFLFAVSIFATGEELAAQPPETMVGRVLEMTVAPEAPFIESFQNGMNTCMMHKPEGACEGALMNLLGGG